MPAPLPPAQDLSHAATLFRLLSDPTRLGILHLTADGELSVSALAEAIGRPGTAISQHLAKLKAQGLVQARRSGTTIYYSQPNEHIALLVSSALQLTEHALYPEPPHHRDQ